MIQTLLSRIGWLLLLLALQIFVFNHIHLAGYATPMPYVYFLLILPGNTPRWLYLTIGFVVGLLLDLFTNTPGVTAASLCAIGLVCPLLLNAFSPKDKSDETLLPSANSMEWGNFLKYAFSICMLHCIIFFGIEAFSFLHTTPLLISILSSTFLTFLIVAGIESIRDRITRKT